jgi:outer membrane protein assembly factor BamB
MRRYTYRAIYRCICIWRRLGVLLAVAVAAALTVAPAASAAAPCTARTTGGEWTAYSHDAANTRTQPDEHALGPAAAANLTPAWVFSTGSTGDGSQLTTTPVVAGGCAFIGSFNGYVYALDASSGHVVWQRKLDAPDPGSGGVIVGAAAVYGQAVVFLVNEFTAPYAIALNRSTGAVIWQSAATPGAACGARRRTTRPRGTCIGAPGTPRARTSRIPTPTRS